MSDQQQKPRLGYWIILIYLGVIFWLIFSFIMLATRSGNKFGTPSWGRDSWLCADGPLAFLLPYRSPYHSPDAVSISKMTARQAGQLAAIIDHEPRSDIESLTHGRELYERNCVSCHGLRGEGGTGPNLADGAWLHGETYNDLVRVINDGIPAKGMIPWGNVMSADDILDVASYTWTLCAAKRPGGRKIIP